MKFWSRAVTAAAVALAMSVASASVVSAAPGKPSRPSSLKATAGDTRVTLTWVQPTLHDPPIDHYTVTRTPGAVKYDTPDTNLIVTNLSNGTQYTFTVTATNVPYGTGPASVPATATPRAIPPDRPTNLGATQTGPGQIRLDWTPPTSLGSKPDGSNASLTRYNITVNPGGTNDTVGPNTLTYSVSGLADNITYTFTVSATNDRPLTGAAAVVYAPLPSGATIGLAPSAGRSTTSVTVTGELFLKNETMTLYWDVTNHVAATVVTDGNGAFTKTVKPFAGDKPGVHKLCTNVQPKPCANFTLQAAPTPTPQVSPTPEESPSPSPTSTESPRASGPRTGGGGINGLDIITRPPFVFLPIIGILGLLGVLAYWALSARRRPMPPAAASVVHHASRPDYMAPFPAPAQPPPTGSPAAAQYPPAQYPQGFEPPAPAPAAPPAAPPSAPPPAPAAPPAAAPPPYVAPASAPPPPSQAAPSSHVEWPAPPAPDEPPDLPEPSDS